ncbi:single-stranded DNA-binding protein [Paenalkalicoccus suaedae]|uniref:Single-stranded DNA-binding protein n=1 Tax=Paenalkalicoccus suaedae TaxID=2592382 RepID=A0A859FHZ3_9BACI|nr:single-stranded DNA-binding protein [Paenalkalicoccus suaedae]QKS72294.1 single-stranded DNA-binding protein [Paenalkalicoccus suaedae]
MNQFAFVGRIVRTPDLMKTKDGTHFTRYALAVRRPFKNTKGQYDTDFIHIVSWNKLAERVATYCTKGSMVSVTGRIQMRQLELGQERQYTIPDIIGETVSFLKLNRESVPAISAPVPPETQPKPPASEVVESDVMSDPLKQAPISEKIDVSAIATAE